MTRKTTKLLKILGAAFLSIGAVSACIAAITHSTKISDSAKATYTQTVQQYYSGIDWNKKEADLKTKLYELITISNPGWSYKGLWTAYRTTDVRPNGTVWDIYSDQTQYVFGDSQCGSYSVEGDCYNREHMIPQSIFSEESPMVSDAHHVLPSDAKVNGMRSNHPHGILSGSATYTSHDGYKLGPGTGNTTVFEPKDDYKGDIARIYFYFVTCYQNRIPNYSFAAFSKDTYPSIDDDFLPVYLQWAKNDPVSQKEIDRNNAIYAQQGNRNPFVDCPYAVGAIWDYSNAAQYGTKGEYTTEVETNGVSISESTATVNVGNTITLSATSSDSSNITWSITNGGKATINTTSTASGGSITVTGVSKGTETVTAKATIGGKDYLKTCVVTVKSNDPQPAIEEETIDLTAQGFTDQQEVGQVDGTAATATFAIATGSTTPKFFTSNNAVRTYAKNTITISSSYTIVEIVLTFSSGDGSNEITANVGTFSDATWTGSSTSVVLTIGGTSGHRRISSIAISYESGGSVEPETVTLNYISLSGQTTEFNLNDEFEFDGVVTAHYSDLTTDNVTELATFTGYDMSVAGEQTITVSYTEDEVTKTATYDITVANPVSQIAYVMYFTKTNGTKYYFTGEMSGYYGATSTDISDATYIYFGTNSYDGNINIYFKDENSDSQYIHIAISGTHVNFVFSGEEPQTGWLTYNSSYKYKIDSKDYYIGGTDSFNTFAGYSNTNNVKLPEFYELSANQWGKDLISSVTCNGGVTAPSTTEWSKMQTIYNKLPDDEKTIILTASGDEDGSYIEQAIARYEEILKKYPNRTSYPDYLNRENGSNKMFMQMNTKSISTLLATIAIISTGAGLVFIALWLKKKER